MTARKINDTSWWVDIRHQGKRYRVRSPENTRAGAAAYEATIRHNFAEGRSPEIAFRKNASVEDTYRAFAEEWFKTYVCTNNKLSEQRTKRTLLDYHLLPWFGETDLAAIGTQEIETYKAAKLRQGLSQKTVKNHLALLSKSLRVATDWGLLKNSPRIQWPRCPPPKTRYLDESEVVSLLASETKQTWRMMILLALQTGMRLGELMALDWSDINLETNPADLIVRRNLVCGVFGSPKNNRERIIPLTEGLCLELRKMRRPHGLVFTRLDKPGNPLTKSVAQRALERVCKAAGLKPVGWHALRHTFATRLLAFGAQQRYVQELLGHSTITMTMRYIHHTPAMLQQTIALLNCAPEPQKENSWATRGQAALSE